MYHYGKKNSRLSHKLGKTTTHLYKKGLWLIRSINKVTTFADTFSDATALASCSKRAIADAWKSNTAFASTTYATKWAAEECVMTPQTDAEFKEATWDWVQNTGAAASKWGVIGDWDVSGVKDFSYALSSDRNAGGGTKVTNGNPKAKAFRGGGLEKWITTSATSLEYLFSGAIDMNVDVSGWDVTKVTTMAGTFASAKKFSGTGLSLWKTLSLTSLASTFSSAEAMNGDLSGWAVEKVTTLDSTFRSASTFLGTGLAGWDTASVATLYYTFFQAKMVNFDAGGWDVSKVKDMSFTFREASVFRGLGMQKWDTSSVTNLYFFSYLASKMDANLAAWDVAKVTKRMDYTFPSISATWSSCNKRKIADAWVTSAAFTAASWELTWSNEVCPALTDTTFKLATWDWAQDSKAAEVVWGDIGSWVVSGVKDFSYALSKHRNKAGGSLVVDGNPKAATCTTTGLGKWATTSATTLAHTFDGAGEMTAVLASWDVSNVVTLEGTFRGATKFQGHGVGAWTTTSVTTLAHTFDGANEMMEVLASWDVSNVETFEGTFRDATQFTGQGMDKWTTTSATTLAHAFDGAGEFIAVLASWDVSSVETLEGTFRGARNFTGHELGARWSTGNVTNFTDTFSGATSLAPCTKRKIVDSWEKNNTAFTTTSNYAAEWATALCTCPAGQAYMSSTLSCAGCAMGFGYTAATFNCTICAAGWHSSTTDNSACVICGEGKYSAGIGEVSCSDCAPGKYGSDEGQISCADCFPGKWQALKGETTCNGTLCSARHFGPPGQTADAADLCSPCGSGKFQNDQGRSVCDGCTIRQQIVTDGFDQDSCENCKPGQLANAAHTGCTCDR